MSLVQEFKDFAVKGNVVDLAVAVVIGGAFNKIVSALVDDIIMPLANFMVPSGDWREAAVSPLHIKVGHFAGAVVDFAIVAAVLFIIVVKLLGKKKPAEPPAA